MRSHSDNHSHIIHSTLDSMTSAAKLANVSALSVTEHVSQFVPLRKEVRFAGVHKSGRMFSSFEEYRDEFSKAPALDGITVRKGLEVDYIEDYAHTLGAAVSKFKWDVLLCSVHELPGGIDVEAKGLPQGKESSANRWNACILTQRKALESNFIKFDVLTHPTRLGVSTPNYPDNIGEMLVDLARLAKRTGIALELNGNDLGRMPELVARVAKACKVADCMVSFGSDAHLPNQISRGFEAAARLVEEFELQLIS